MSNWNSSADEVPSDGVTPPRIHKLHLAVRRVDVDRLSVCLILDSHLTVSMTLLS